MQPVVQAAIVSGVFAIMVAAIQLSVQRQNRKDHGETARELQEVKAIVNDARLATFDTRLDVQEMRGELDDHGKRITNLERAA
jgi:hypothetical protein